MSYEITWITDYLGVGRAPMSYDEFDNIREQGVHGIINLCHEYSDLHDLERQAGFEVYYLPIYDECAPDMDELEKGLQWLDEAIYLKKKILVHCRFGQGRTGTITSAYLLRRGLGMKQTKKELKKTMARPSTYRQWKFLRKYSKKQGSLSIKVPKIAHDQTNNLFSFFREYEALAETVDQEMAKNNIQQLCGHENDRCCHASFQIPLLEAIYLNDSMNRTLTAEARTSAIERALACSKLLQNSLQCFNPHQLSGFQEHYTKDKILCPLSVDGSCILFESRPIRCRPYGGEELGSSFLEPVMNELTRLSNEAFFVLAGEFPQGQGIYSSLIDTVSGKFIQTYFHLMAQVKN